MELQSTLKMFDVVHEDDGVIDKDKEMLHGSHLAAAMYSSLPFLSLV